LKGAAAQHVFAFDRENLDASDAAVLVLPAGKSGHLELGYMAGKGKKTYILMDKEPERFDVMYCFATSVHMMPVPLIDELKRALA
jgi:nucleoside 2-deoxyribosyltransferase